MTSERPQSAIGTGRRNVTNDPKVTPHSDLQVRESDVPSKSHKNAPTRNLAGAFAIYSQWPLLFGTHSKVQSLIHNLAAIVDVDLALDRGLHFLTHHVVPSRRGLTVGG